MSCNCKKKNNVQPVPEPSTMTIKIVESPQTPDLTVVKQQQLDEIIMKINQINTNS